VIMGGRALKPRELKEHLTSRVTHIRTKQLAKLLELGVVVLAD